MPKTNAEMVRASAQRRRLRAREAGLCVVCCKLPPNPGCVECPACAAGKALRKKQRRDALRQTAELQRIVETYERAGDVSYSHWLYEEAAQQYQLALNVQTITMDERVRISEKRARTLFHGNDSSEADRWLNETLPMHLASLGDTPEAVKFLLRRVDWLWVSADCKRLYALCKQAIEIAKKIGCFDLCRSAYIRASLQLYNLSQLAEAKRHLELAANVSETEDAATSCTYYDVSAALAANFGEEQKAREYFQHAEQIASKLEYFAQYACWRNRASSMLYLGDMESAKDYSGRALLAARKSRTIWAVSFACLIRAGIFDMLGADQPAYAHVIEAFSYGALAPEVAVAAAEIGISVALRAGDQALLKQCADEQVLRKVLDSDSPLIVAPIAAAFAQMYAARGEKKRASSLLQKALVMMPPFVQAACCGFAVEIARSGFTSDFERARKLIENRTNLPANRVEKAYLELFDAFVAQRTGKTEMMYEHARRARKGFFALQWHRYVQIADALLPESERRQADAIAQTSGASSALYSPREREVVNLILEGLTNTSIAERLSIKVRTVEAHVTSILSQAGVRSRYQLREYLKSM